MGEAAFLRKLRQAFAGEARERLAAMEAALMGLEASPGPRGNAAALIEAFYRDVHSLKGASRTVDALALETVCQPLESVLGALKAGRIAASPRLMDLLHRSLKAVGDMLSRFDPEAGGQSLPRADDPFLLGLAADLTAAAEGRETSAEPPTAPVSPASPAASKARPEQVPPVAATSGPAKTAEMLRLPSERLERLMRDCEEFLPEKQALAELTEEAARLREGLRLLRRHMDLLMAAVSQGRPGEAPGQADGELSPLLERCAGLGADLSAAARAHAMSLAARQRGMSAKIDELLGDLKQALTVPFSRLFERFPKMVRDLSRDLGKEAELVLESEDLEVDRRILDHLHDPFLHLLRNAVDHGLEPPAERRLQGKPERGRIGVRVRLVEQDRIEVVISDDGRGIDQAAVLDAARSAGLIDPGQAGGLGQEAALDLIFRSGMSTSLEVTEFSGRGLGLAIVREHVERLGGTLRLESRPGQGAAFHLSLPLSLSSFPALAVLAGGRTFMLAKSGIERVLLLDPEDILRFEGRDAVTHLGSPLTVLDLADILELPASPAAREDVQGRDAHVLVAVSGHRRLALRVDALLGEREIMVKPLGGQLRRVRNVAGVTVLGDGRLAPILHVPDLIASGLDAKRSGPGARPAPAEPPRPRSVLVVEDSVTSRMLLKGILESAGFRVATAVDGVEALTRLREARPDLVVSDVQMPRMDGLDLTRRIREDKALAGLPVVLVTSLDSPLDRERGVDAGASAYIVKSSFDHGNLLETVRRLI